jgi:NhaA family Na+:H+ antiporter
VLVIAVFYTADLRVDALAAAAACLLLALAANRLGVRHPVLYLSIGALMWIAVLYSGVHATIAGVLMAFMIPSRTVIDQRDFLQRGRAVLNHFEQASKDGTSNVLTDIEQQIAVESLEDACEKVQPPLQRLEHALHPWVSMVIMPLFALANAGVAFPSDLAALAGQPITLGVVLGLVLGKPIGITLVSWLAVRTGISSLPENVSWMHIHGAGWLAGIGFTMSLFMAGLSFTEESHLTAAKLGIVIASVLAGTVGSLILLRLRPKPSDAAAT